MANWTRDEHLTFDIAFALKKVTPPRLSKGAERRRSHCHCGNDFGAPKALPLGFQSHPNLFNIKTGYPQSLPRGSEAARPPVTRAQASSPDVRLRCLHLPPIDMLACVQASAPQRPLTIIINSSSDSKRSVG